MIPKKPFRKPADFVAAANYADVAPVVAAVASEPCAWSDSKIPVSYSFKMPAHIHEKMRWITQNVPRHTSMQKIMAVAVAEYVERLIAEHYRSD